MQKTEKLHRKIRAPFERAAIHFGMALLPHLPRRGVLAIAVIGGRLGYWFDTRGRRVGLANLDIAFGGKKTAAEKKKILKTSFVTMVLTLIDTFWFAYKPEERLEKYVNIDERSQVFFEDKAQVCITAHFGNWEIMGQLSGLKGKPLTSIGATIKNPTVDKYLIRARETTGQRIVPRTGALRKLLGTLRKNGKVSFLADQNTSENNGGIWVDFFGLPALVTAAPGLLASRTKTETLIAFCAPVPGGHYRIYTTQTLDPPPESNEKTIQQLMDAITVETEEEILRNPEHWLWMYKRWRTKKPGTEGAGYPWYCDPLRAGSPTE